MRELSVFADESGDTSYQSKYYLLTLVFHDQADCIDAGVTKHENALRDAGLPNGPFHLSPLLNGHDHYASLEIATRKQMLVRFFTFVKLSPIRYATFLYNKNETSPERLIVKIKQDLINFLVKNLDYFQQYDTIKIYYDNGQKLITNSIKAAIEYVISANTAFFKDGDPSYYRLAQAADLLCGFELLAAKFAANEQTVTDEIFFINKGNFRKNYLRQLRAKRLF